MPVPLSETVSYQLTQAAKRQRNYTAKLLREVGLCPGQDLLLHQLASGAYHSPKKLAIDLDVKPPTVTKMVRHLVESGLVMRCQNDTDKRSAVLSLTLQGRTKVERVYEIWEDLELRVTEGLNPEIALAYRMMLQKTSKSLVVASTEAL